jgi:hypothetical protein
MLFSEEGLEKVGGGEIRLRNVTLQKPDYPTPTMGDRR